MNILFPMNMNHKSVDQFWKTEAEAAKKAGFEISLVTDTHFSEPINIINKSDNYLYRGWLVKPQSYLEICDLTNDALFNSIADYMWTYEFPVWYNAFSNDETPISHMVIAADIQEFGLENIAKQVSQKFGNKSLIIKDWLKSRKHEWYDACFIRDASDIEESVRIMTNFCKLQGRDFYGGLVFREFLSLKQLGIHPKSRMPLPIEYRTFFLKKEPIFIVPYWDNDVPYDDKVHSPPIEWLNAIGRKLESPFVALDIAQDQNDKWWVIEVNDGGSAGTPERCDLNHFYDILYKKLNR